MTISTRQAVLTDLEPLSVLFDAYRRFYEQPADLQGARAFLRERMHHQQSVLFLAHDGETPVGFTQLYPSFSSAAMARTFVLNDLYVAEAARRRGVGAKLLQAAAAYARTVGAVRLTLSTALTNRPAQTLYAAEGWKRDETFMVFHLKL